jgi:hypothetical protein
VQRGVASAVSCIQQRRPAAATTVATTAIAQLYEQVFQLR